MFCYKCGNMLPEGSNYCSVCGTPITEMQEEPAPDIPADNNAAPDGAIGTPDRKAARKPVILLGLGLLIVVICITGYMLLYGGDSKEKTIARFEKAFNDQDDQTVSSLMFPKESRETAAAYSNELISRLQSYRDTVGSIRIDIGDDADIAAAPDAIQTGVTELLSQYNIAFDSLTLTNIQLTCQNDVTDPQTLRHMNQLICYHTDNKWYVLPWCVDYNIECRQNADIQTAAALGTALSSCIASEDVYNSILPYANTVITMADIKYLPEIFQQTLTSYLGCAPETLTILHNADGATGYAFMLDAAANQFHVYISNGQYMNAWEILPAADTGYTAGAVTEGADKISAASYCYARLISSESPMLGYWQADNAGIYIGYNTSGGSEGLAVYYAFAAAPYENCSSSGIMSPLFNWTVTGGNGYLNISRFEGEETYSFVLNADGTLTLNTVSAAYTLAPGAITADMRSRYVGTWLCDDFQYNAFWEDRSLQVCETCGYLHTDSYADSFHNGTPFVELYNGTYLHYIFPDTGLYVKGAESGWYGIEYCLLEDGGMEIEEYRHGGGGGMALHYVREDSERGAYIRQLEPALMAYSSYMESLDNTNNHEIRYHYALIYVNGDDIPELYCDSMNDMAGRFILAYNAKENEAYPIVAGGYATVYSYREREGILLEYTGMHMTETQSFYRLSEDGTKCEALSSAYATAVFSDDVDYEDPVIDDQPATVKAYKKFSKKYGELKSLSELELKDSLGDAYSSL